MASSIQRAAARKMMDFNDKAKLDPSQVRKRTDLESLLLPTGTKRTRSNSFAPYKSPPKKKFSRKGQQA